MVLSGIQPFTLLDFPGRCACIAFTPGCQFRCGYCHNPEFVLPEQIQKMQKSFIPDKAFFAFLKKRQKVLDGVVISGGEPTMSPGLEQFIQHVKEMGFQVKLDSNGYFPNVLKRLIDKNLVDYIAMDVKTSIQKYEELTQGCKDPQRIVESIELIKHAGREQGIEYEFRSTLIREIHTPAVLQEMAKLMDGAFRLFLQSFRPDHTLDPTFSQYTPFSFSEMQSIMQEYFAPFVDTVEIRT